MNDNVENALKAIKADFDKARIPLEEVRDELWQTLFQLVFIHGEPSQPIADILNIPESEIDYGLSDMADVLLRGIDCGWGKRGAARLAGLTVEQIDQFLEENRD